MRTSDSLAAESMEQGGSFAQGQGAAASSQPSRSTTSNNTDTSGASTLDAAPDAAARRDGSNGQDQYGGPGSGATGGGDATYNTSQGGGPSSYSGEAPSATGGSYGLTDEQAKPKGKNITEGGFSSDDPNASFSQDIGSSDDPSRGAEQDIQAGNAKAPAYAGFEGASAKGLQGGQGGFENLGSEEQA